MSRDLVVHFTISNTSVKGSEDESGDERWLWKLSFKHDLDKADHHLVKGVRMASDAALTTSPFVQAIREASAYCVVRNSEMDVFGRIWCVCELMYAKHYGLFPSKATVTGPDVFAALQTSVLDAQATELQDRDRILRVLLTEFNREEIDGFVHRIRMQHAQN